jgi:hypothetical protein
MIDDDDVAYMTSELYGYQVGDVLPNGRRVTKVIPGAAQKLPIDFFISTDCREADVTFRGILNNTPFADVNDTWTSNIMVGGRMLVKFEYSPSDDENVSIKISDDDSIMGPPLSAADSQGNQINIDNTMRKTAGDINLLLYSIANRKYAVTGDRSAAAMYLYFTYLLSLNFAESDAPDVPHFIFETNAPAQNACIVSPPLLTRQTGQPDQIPVSRTTFCLRPRNFETQYAAALPAAIAEQGQEQFERLYEDEDVEETRKRQRNNNEFRMEGVAEGSDDENESPPEEKRPRTEMEPELPPDAADAIGDQTPTTFTNTIEPDMEEGGGDFAPEQSPGVNYEELRRQAEVLTAQANNHRRMAASSSDDMMKQMFQNMANRTDVILKEILKRQQA